MQSICIGIDGHSEDIMQHMNNELLQLRNKKINYSIDEVNSEGSTSIICRIDDDKDDKYDNDKPAQSYNILKIMVSNALADYIINQYEEKLINRIINTNYCYFNALERKEILAKAIKAVKNEDKSFLNTLLKIRRRNVIVRKLLDYFESTDSLILDGFVNFRLKEYIKDLEEVVDKAVDDFLMEREYKEFIRLLRYFVDIQEPKYDAIHVIVGFDNKYILLDEKKREITNECIKEFISEIPEGDINYDDLLVSTLITFAPRKIVIHCTGQLKNKELLETVKNVFLGKVFLCNGCETCVVNMVKSEK